MAVSALTLLLALSHKLLLKDRLTREGRWQQKLDYMGTGLTGRTLGLIGLGNIGREILHIAAPLEMRYVAFDPYISADRRPSGVELLGLDSLLIQSDFVCICCAVDARDASSVERRAVSPDEAGRTAAQCRTRTDHRSAGAHGCSAPGPHRRCRARRFSRKSPSIPTIRCSRSRT